MGRSQNLNPGHDIIFEGCPPPALALWFYYHGLAFETGADGVEID